MSVFHIAYTMHHTHVTHKEIYNLAATHTTCTVASATHVTFEIHGDARENIQYKPRENLKNYHWTEKWTSEIHLRHHEL